MPPIGIPYQVFIAIHCFRNPVNSVCNSYLNSLAQNIRPVLACILTLDLDKTSTSEARTLVMDPSLQSSDQPVDLTEHITRTGDYPTAVGGFGDVWRCILQAGSNQIVVRIPAPTIIIFSGLSRLQSK